MRRATAIVGIAAAVVVAFALGLAVAGGGGGTTARGSSIADEVRAELAGRYYRPVPPEVLRLPDVREMIAALHDPYTEFLDPARYRLLRRETTGIYSGVGLTLLPGRDGVVVARVQSGPAQVAGIRHGDSILSIDGSATRRLSYEEALGRILGEPGSVVRLRVRRGPHTFEYPLVRRQFRALAVRSRLLASGGDRIGYVALSSFSLGAAQAVERSVQRLEAGHVRALVLDLRGNPGGLLDQAVGVASLFLDNAVIASTEGAHQPAHVYRAAPGQKSRLPLVVLVDGASASAAEIVAAALHDNHRATVVGERTFGKGLVQSIEPLAAGAAIKMTVARYLTPLGMDLSERGVQPDVAAEDNPLTSGDEALAAAMRVVSHRLM